MNTYNNQITRSYVDLYLYLQYLQYSTLSIVKNKSKKRSETISIRTLVRNELENFFEYFGQFFFYFFYFFKLIFSFKILVVAFPRLVRGGRSLKYGLFGLRVLLND